jgi:hypothetical protein
LQHEHQNPSGGIQWNREAVIADLSGPPNNWKIEMIENNKKALDYYTQAVALDPQFALAYGAMAVNYANLAGSGADPAEMLDQI